MIHTDQSGNQYRKQGDEWQVMRPGVGWGPFTCAVDIQLTSGEVIPASAKQHDEPKWSEAEKSLIIAQARDLHIHLVISGQHCTDVTVAGGKHPELIDQSGDYAVSFAVNLVEALKREGAL